MTASDVVRGVGDGLPSSTIAGFSLRGVSLSRGAHRVLRGVDVSFAVGRVCVISGGNGVGKSTLLAALAGRLAPTRGEIRWCSADGQSLHGAHLREVVGWLGHELGLYPDLTVAENIALHAELRGLSVDAASQDWSRLLGLSVLSNRRVRDLSRGQRQRAALGRVLAGGPVAVLLDEPSTGLDAPARASLGIVVERVAASGRCVVVVTHDGAFHGELDRRCRSAVPSVGGVLHFILEAGTVRQVGD